VGVRDNMWGNAPSELKPAERIEDVFFAQAVNPYWVLVTWLIVVIAHAFRVVVVTDQRILVWQGGSFSRSAIEGVPRQTKIDPPKGLWYRTDSLGETLWVPKQFTRTSGTTTAHGASICAVAP
jgi:hypothetical protein